MNKYFGNSLFKVFIAGFLISPATSFAFSKTMTIHQVKVQVSEKCESKIDQIRQALSPLLNTESSLAFSAIKTLRGEKGLQNFRHLSLNIEDFGTRKDFRGFFNHHNHKSEIWLDCAQGSILSWPGLLTHELIHYANRDLNLPTWLDEMLAQIAESRAQLRFPHERIDILKNTAIMPGFLNTEKPLRRQADYATSLLFGLYLYQNFSGSEFMPQIQNGIKNLEDLSALLQDFTKTKHQYDWIQQHLGAQDLIRYFALAMNINLPMRNSGSLYQVPGWSGFEDPAKTLVMKSGTYFLEPAGFMRIHSNFADKISVTDTGSLAGYRILKNQKTFKIQLPNEPVTGNWEENFLLLINLSTTQSFEITL